MKAIKTAFTALALVIGTFGLHLSNFTALGAIPTATQSTTQLASPTTVSEAPMVVPGVLSTKSVLPQRPKKVRKRVKQLVHPPVGLDTWIELYHILYPPQSVSRVKKMVSQTYTSASKLMLKDAVKGLFKESSGQKEDEKADLPDLADSHQTFNSSSLLRKLLGKDFLSDSDSDSDSDSSSSSGDSLCSNSDDDQYGWDFDYETYESRRNSSRKGFPAIHVNYTNSTTNGTAPGGPAHVVLPVISNNSNFSSYHNISVKPQESKADSTTQWVRELIFAIMVVLEVTIL